MSLVVEALHVGHRPINQRQVQRIDLVRVKPLAAKDKQEAQAKTRRHSLHSLLSHFELLIADALLGVDVLFEQRSGRCGLDAASSLCAYDH